MSLAISRVLHAGYIFQSKETKIIFDPIFETPFSNNCYPFPKAEFDLDKLCEVKFDAIVISHYHDDHLSFASLNLLDRSIPIYIYCLHEVLIEMLKRLGFKYVTQINLKSKITIGDIEITPYPALDIDVDSIFHIRFKNINVLNVVDSWIDYDTLNELCQIEWDMVLWPFQTMREIEVLTPQKYPNAETKLPKEWIEQLTKLRPKAIVPSSCQFNFEEWSWYRSFYFPISYNSFSEQIKNALPTVNIIRLNPGESINFDDRSVIARTNNIEWIKPIGDQNVDYRYDNSIVIPDLINFSKNFKQLNQEQRSEVFDFCTRDLLKKFISLNSNSEFFNSKKTWKLVVASSSQDIFEYYYEICDGHIQQLANVNSKFDWLTEIPETKLYDAIKNFEALNSIYIRINNYDFDDENRAKLAEIDVFEDPLIRVLYENSFASYQRNQLEKILASHV